MCVRLLPKREGNMATRRQIIALLPLMLTGCAAAGVLSPGKNFTTTDTIPLPRPLQLQAFLNGASEVGTSLGYSVAGVNTYTRTVVLDAGTAMSAVTLMFAGAINSRKVLMTLAA